jgi:SAM-dependent methyltransferase
MSLAPVGGRTRTEGWLSHGDRRVALWLFVLVCAGYLLVQEGGISGYDGRTMYGVTQAVIERSTFAVDPELNTLPGRGGLEYSRYGLGLSLLAAIPYLLLRPLVALAPDPDRLLEGAVAATMAFVMGGLVVALFLLGRRLGAGVRPAAIVAVGGVLGTFALPYGKEFFSEPLAALCLVVAVERLLARRPGWAGVALGLAVLTRPQNALLVPVFAAVAWRRDGLRALPRLGLGLLPGVAVTVAYNMLRFGNPLDLGYQDVGLTTPFLKGATGLLVEPRKSVLLFAPIVLLLPWVVRHSWRTNRLATVLIGAQVAITVGLTAKWFAWHGGWSWGPRLLLPAVLLAVVLVAPWLTTRRRVAAAALLFAAGFLVSCPALIVSTQTQQLETTPVPASAHYLDTQPLASPRVDRQWELVEPVARYSVEHRYDGGDDGHNYMRYLSLWQFGAMRDLGRTGLAAGLVGTAVLLAVVAVASRRLLVALRSADAAASPAGPGPTPGSGASGPLPTPVPTPGPTAAPAASGAENLEAMDEARNYHRYLVDTVLGEADPGRPVLDFGAGTGFHARALRDRGLHVTCVEPHQALRDRLCRDGLPAVATAGESAPRSFGTVYSLNVLEHIEDDASALRDLRARLAPGGKLVLYVPAFAVLFSAMDRYVGHHRRYRRVALERLVRSADLRVVRSEYVDSVGFAASLVYRLLRRDGTVTARSVLLYDRFAFPVSRVLDRLTRGLVGKNLLVVAARD